MSAAALLHQNGSFFGLNVCIVGAVECSEISGSLSIKGQAASLPQPAHRNVVPQADGKIPGEVGEVGLGRVSPGRAECVFAQPRTSRTSGHALLSVCVLCCGTSLLRSSGPDVDGFALLAH